MVRALERMAARVPQMPGEDETLDAPARRADALVALCSARIASDPDPDRATVVVHAALDGLVTGSSGAELEGGSVVHPETVRRLLCNARVQTVVEDGEGDVIGMGRLTREPSAAMVRQIRHRDRECRFPGCGARTFTEAHHVTFWRHGGRTDLENLVLDLFVPPQAGARAGLATRPGPRRAGPVVQARRAPLPRGAVPRRRCPRCSNLGARDRLMLQCGVPGRPVLAVVPVARGARAGPDRSPQEAVNSRVGRGSRSSPGASRPSAFGSSA